MARGGLRAARAGAVAEPQTEAPLEPRFRRKGADAPTSELGPPPGAARGAMSVLGLALIAALVALNDVWAAQASLVVLLLTLPGSLLLRALRVPRRAVATFPVYVPCASIVVLVSAGLAVDLIGPVLGVEEPLRTMPLLVGLEAVALALLLFGLRAPPETGVPWTALPSRVRIAWPLLLPLAAAAGAVLLTNGHGRPGVV